MNMRLPGFLAGTVALVFASGVFAADLPRRVAPATPIAAVPTFTWTGFYVGAHAGYGRRADSFSPRGFDEAFAELSDFFGNGGNQALLLPAGRMDRDAFLGGAQAGFNYQLGTFVVGLEADISAMHNESGKVHGTFADGTGEMEPLTLAVRSNLDWLGTVRARAGITFDRLLVYATGGLAFGDVSYATTYTNPEPVSATDSNPDNLPLGTLVPDIQGSGRTGGTQTGYTLGAGLEYAFIDNLTLKAEYLYYDLGNTTMQITATDRLNPQVAAGSFIERIRTNGHIARMGVNFKF